MMEFGEIAAYVVLVSKKLSKFVIRPENGPVRSDTLDVNRRV